MRWLRTGSQFAGSISVVLACIALALTSCGEATATFAGDDEIQLVEGERRVVSVLVNDFPFNEVTLVDASSAHPETASVRPVDGAVEVTAHRSGSTTATYAVEGPGGPGAATIAITVVPLQTATPVPRATPEPTATPMPTATPVPTSTPLPTPTATPVPTPTATPLPTPTATPLPTPTPPIVPVKGSAEDVAYVLNQINGVRAARGLAPLILDPTLSAMASGWSATMSNMTGAACPWAHRPLEQQLELIPREGRVGLSENVWCSFGVAQGQDELEASGEHSNNMVGNYTHVGIGICTDGERVWITQNFVLYD